MSKILIIGSILIVIVIMLFILALCKNAKIVDRNAYIILKNINETKNNKIDS